MSIRSALDWKDLKAEDPLMKASLELRSTRLHNISMSSISTNITDIFCLESENVEAENGKNDSGTEGVSGSIGSFRKPRCVNLVLYPPLLYQTPSNLRFKVFQYKLVSNQHFQ